MKRILATTAIATLTAMPLLADSNGNAEQASGNAMPEITVGSGMLSADTLIGKRIYIPGGSGDDELSLTDLTDAPDSWEDAGEVGDVVIGQDGQVQSVIADIGGFLGVGEREVALTMDNLRFAPDRDEEGEYFVVYSGDSARLEEKESFEQDDAGQESWLLSMGQDGNRDAADSGEGDDMAAGSSAEGDAMTTEGAEDETMTAEGAESDAMKSESAEGETMTAEGTEGDTMKSDKATAGDRMAAEGSGDGENAYGTAETAAAQDGDAALAPEERAALVADDLEGQPVMGPDGDQIGEVSALVLNDGGDVDRVVIDVGGFLGIGEKPVAIPFDDIEIARAEGDNLRLTTEHSESALEQMERWKG